MSYYNEKIWKGDHWEDTTTASAYPCPSCHNGTLLVKSSDGNWRCPRVGDAMALSEQYLQELAQQ
jgi:hypothetical protein